MPESLLPLIETAIGVVGVIGAAWLAYLSSGMARLAARVEALEKQRREDQRLIIALGDHIDTLEYHIYMRKPPPPPPRPDGLQPV